MHWTVRAATRPALASSASRLMVCYMCSVAPQASPLLAATDCFRPWPDDVDAISWGRRAKQRGTGSRGTPHRLNTDERTLFDIARRKGFVEMSGSGWRKERSGSPLKNTYRSWCDAQGVPAIFVHKQGRADSLDEVLVDLSPLRTPGLFAAASSLLLEHAPGGLIEMEGDEEGIFEDEALESLFRSEPIYRLPVYSVVWHRERPEAKALAKSLASLLATVGEAGTKHKGRVKAKGAPNRKAGKSRRHGGYGIEG